MWASPTRGKRTSSSRPPTGVTSGSSARYGPRPVRCTSVARRSRPAAWSPGATLLDAGAEGRVWSLDVSKRYISRRITAHPSKSRRQRLPWSESLARRFSARPGKFATFALWVLPPGRPGGITATHRLDGWICPSAVDRRPQRMAGSKTRIHKGATLGVRNRVVVRARLGRPSSRAGGGRGQQREHGLHHQRVDTRRGRESGPRADAEAEAPRELQGPVHLSGASGLPSGRPHRPPQRTGHRGLCGAARTTGPPRGAQRKRLARTGPGGSPGQVIGDALANGRPVLFGYLSR